MIRRVGKAAIVSNKNSTNILLAVFKPKANNNWLLPRCGVPLTSQGWLVGWLFNGTSTQNGQFVPTVLAETAKDGRIVKIVNSALEEFFNTGYLNTVAYREQSL